MKTNITGRKVSLKDSFIERANRKLDKLNKFFSDDAHAEMVVKVEKNRQTVELTVHDRSMIFRAEETANTMEDALETVYDRIVRQIRKNKTRIENRTKSSFAQDAFSDIEETVIEETYDVIKTKKFALKAMDVEEAIMQMNLLNHEFFIFLDAASGLTSVVYARKNGQYGLLQAEA